MSLFLPAGTLDWWRAWVFLGVVLVAAVASTAALYRSDMALLEERFKPPVQKGQPLADKILILLLIATFIGLIAWEYLRGSNSEKKVPIRPVGLIAKNRRMATVRPLSLSRHVSLGKEIP